MEGVRFKLDCLAETVECLFEVFLLEVGQAEVVVD
jgi:hypothetical protein